MARRRRRAAAERMPLLRLRPRPLVRARLLGQYLALLPSLLFRRRRLARARRAPVVMLFYHSVANRPLNHMTLPLEEFVRQVEFLRRYHEILSLDDAVARLDAGANDRVAVAITFDDGYRDNAWAIEYLRYFDVPASFFVSIGHVLTGHAFEHDRRLGFHAASPMAAADVQVLARDGFVVGSHGIDHEDFGRLAPAAADRVLGDSRRLIGKVTGREPEHFSFPFGQRGLHITAESYALAEKHYRYVYSAYGGYNFPTPGRRHFLRISSPMDVMSLAMIMDGYTGFRACLSGDAWGLATHALPPF